MTVPTTPIVKVCGITSPADAVLCREAGVHWLGLVFAPGPWRIGAVRAAEIRRAVPDAVVAGVFLDTSCEEVLATAATVGLDLLQIHGDPAPATCAELRARSGLPLIHAVGEGRPGEGGSYPESLCEIASYLLFDVPAAGDGLLARAAGAVRAGRRVILGGVGPDNVREAVARVRPFGLDVTRGVERAPGAKDPDALRTLMSEVRRAAEPASRPARLATA